MPITSTNVKRTIGQTLTAITSDSLVASKLSANPMMVWQNRQGQPVHKYLPEAELQRCMQASGESQARHYYEKFEAFLGADTT